MSRFVINLFAQTSVGMVRAGNEDSFLVADLTAGRRGLAAEVATHEVGERGSLLVVSDGMGGAAAGEIASDLAVTTLYDALLNLPLDLDHSERLIRATELANERIWEHAERHSELTGMGATLTAVLAHTGRAYIAQVGDSRAYLMRGEQVKQLTRDQSLAQMLLDAGTITPEQAAAVPQNVIMQALGTQPTVSAVLSQVELCRGDAMLLCSDGLSNKVDAYEMRRVIKQADNLEAVCRRLIESANERGGEDNITVVVASFDGDALPQPSTRSSITGSYRTYSGSGSRFGRERDL